MNIQKYLKFPTELSDARRRAGISQKAAALAIGIDQSYLCALEKGRRTVPGNELIARIGHELKCDPATVARMLCAAEHDRSIGHIATQEALRPGLGVISAAIWVVGALSADELAGLEAYISMLNDAKKRLLTLASRRDAAVNSEEEVTMR